MDWLDELEKQLANIPGAGFVVGEMLVTTEMLGRLIGLARLGARLNDPRYAAAIAREILKVDGMVEWEPR